jgi:transposase
MTTNRLEQLKELIKTKEKGVKSTLDSFGGKMSQEET